MLISGASGAVGSMALQLARASGARVAIAVDAAGADDASFGDGEVERVRIDGIGAAGIPAAFDLLIDAVGGAPLAALLTRLVPGGRAVLVGYTAGRRVELDLADLMQRDIRLLPLNMLRREAEARAAAPELLARLADGRLKLALRTFALSQAGEAMAWIAERGHRGRAVLTPDPVA